MAGADISAQATHALILTSCNVFVFVHPISLSADASLLCRLMSSSSAGLPRRRCQPALSCSECHRRKVKCDRREPCTRCVTSKISCTYGASRSSGNLPSRFSSVSVGHAEAFPNLPIAEVDQHSQSDIVSPSHAASSELPPADLNGTETASQCHKVFYAARFSEPYTQKLKGVSEPASQSYSRH